MPLVLFSVIALSFIKDFISALVIASFISSNLFESSRIFFPDVFNICAASRFCILSCILYFLFCQKSVFLLLFHLFFVFFAAFFLCFLRAFFSSFPPLFFLLGIF